MRLILASTSPYRRQLLQRLRLPFDTARPEVDESPRPGESAAALASRLAEAKARAVASEHRHACVIGSDQSAGDGERILGKPGDIATAQAQLAAASGRTLRFFTAIHLITADAEHTAIDVTDVQFRALNHDEITRYIASESPLDCAGSFKCEGLGITLFEAIRSDDPTALIGLPLIALSRLLRRVGYELP